MPKRARRGAGPAAARWAPGVAATGPGRPAACPRHPFGQAGAGVIAGASWLEAAREWWGHLAPDFLQQLMAQASGCGTSRNP